MPRFFDRDETGLPPAGSRTMKASIESVVPPFSAHRMVRDYASACYLPAAARSGLTLRPGRERAVIRGHAILRRSRCAGRASSADGW